MNRYVLAKVHRSHQRNLSHGCDRHEIPMRLICDELSVKVILYQLQIGNNLLIQPNVAYLKSQIVDFVFA